MLNFCTVRTNCWIQKRVRIRTDPDQIIINYYLAPIFLVFFLMSCNFSNVQDFRCNVGCYRENKKVFFYVSLCAGLPREKFKIVNFPKLSKQTAINLATNNGEKRTFEKTWYTVLFFSVLFQQANKHIDSPKKNASKYIVKWFLFYYYS